MVIKISVVVIYTENPEFFPFSTASMKLLLFRDFVHDMPVAGIYDSFLCVSLVQELVHTSDQAASYLECWLRLHLHYFIVVRPYPGLRRWFSVYFLSKHEDPSSSSRSRVKSKAGLCVCNPSTMGEGLETRGSLGPLTTSLAPLSVKDPVL